MKTIGIKAKENAEDNKAELNEICNASSALPFLTILWAGKSIRKSEEGTPNSTEGKELEKTNAIEADEIKAIKFSLFAIKIKGRIELMWTPGISPITRPINTPKNKNSIIYNHFF